MGEAPVAIKIDHGLLRELRGITVYVKGRTLVPLDFATAHIAGTNRVSMTRIKFWRVTEIDAECVFPSGGINCIADRSEEHTSELQSLMRTSYAVFCLKKKN